MHQIELELQNEELLEIQARLENNRRRYAHLFENAPVGYVILDSVGIIKHFNHTFLKMNPEIQLKSSGQPFADLLDKTDAGAFRARDNQLWQIMFTKYGTRQPDCRHA